MRGDPIAEGVVTGFAEVNGARLYHESAGEGPPLVLVHAGIADLRMWDGQFEPFAEGHRTVRWDMRGFGRSPMVEAPFSNREDLFGLMKHLQIASGSLLGCSMGGGMIIDFALEHPAMVNAMVLVGSAVGGFASEGPEPPQWQALVAAYRAGDLSEAARLEAELWVVGTRASAEDVDASILAQVQEMDEIALGTEKDRNRLEQPLETPSIDRLSEITAPTLIIVGGADTAEMQDAADLLTREIAGAKKVVMRDAGHLPNLEHPAEFNRLVLQFLAAP
jgi:3-oxoadipate enol-lactonase